jgi:PAS domain S-box-containing protein
MNDPPGTTAMNASTAPSLPMGLEGDILKSLRVPLAVIDNEFRFLWLNREMAWIYQARPEQVTGRICYQLMSADTIGPCHDCPVAAVQKSGRREISQKYKDFPDGDRKYGEITAFPIYGPQREIVATLVMVMDITNKIVVDLDATHQMLARLMPSLQGLTPRPPDAFASNRVNERGERTRRGKKSDLSQRETQVLHLLTKGHSNTQIASRLGISPHTVKSHVINIFNKLGVNDRIQAAVVATKQRIVE